MTPSGTLTGTGARAGYPQIVVPAGYNAANRLPVGIAFNGTAYSEEKLLAFAYAYEQKTKLRKPVSEINPAVWRCYSGNPRSCAPGQGGRDRRNARLPARDGDGRRPAGPDDGRHADRDAS